LEQVLLQLQLLLGCELPDEGFDLALDIGCRLSKGGLHRLGYLDLAIALAAPEQIVELLDVEARAELANVSPVVRPDLSRVAHWLCPLSVRCCLPFEQFRGRLEWMRL